MLVKDLVWLHACNHAKVTKLSDIKDGRQRHNATKEVHYWVWSCIMKLLEPLKILFVDANQMVYSREALSSQEQAQHGIWCSSQQQVEGEAAA
jgi:hypothetical protein